MAGKVHYKGQWCNHEDVRERREADAKAEKAKLKKAPAKKKEVVEEVKEPSVKAPEIPEDAAIAAEDNVVEEAKPDAEESIETLREKFEAKFGQPVSNNKKNDAEWIAQKLNS